MRVCDLRHLLRKYGVSRIYLHSKHKKISRRKKRFYDYGYVEFDTIK